MYCTIAAEECLGQEQPYGAYPSSDGIQSFPSPGEVTISGHSQYCNLIHMWGEGEATESYLS